MPGSVAHGALPPVPFQPPTEPEPEPASRTEPPRAEVHAPASPASHAQRRAIVHPSKGRGACWVAVVGQDQVLNRPAAARAPLAQPEAVNDAGPVVSQMLSNIAPPTLPKLSREDEGELYGGVCIQLALLADGLRKPLSWKERLLPRCLRRTPAPEKNEVLRRLLSVGDAVVQLADSRPDPAGYQVAFSRLVDGWVTDGHDRCKPQERERWRWRMNDPKGSFMAACKALHDKCGDVRDPLPQPRQNLREAYRVLMALTQA